MNEDLLIAMRRKAHKDAVVELVFGIIFTLVFMYGLFLWLTLLNGKEEDTLGWIFAIIFGAAFAFPMMGAGIVFGIPNLFSGIYGLIASKYEDRLLKNKVYYLVMGIVYLILAVAVVAVAISIGTGEGGDLLASIAIGLAVLAILVIQAVNKIKFFKAISVVNKQYQQPKAPLMQEQSVENDPEVQ